MSLAILFLVAALVAFILATIPIASRINLTALGLVFTTAAALVSGIRL